MSSWRSTTNDPPTMHDSGWRLESPWVLVWDGDDMMVAKLCAYPDEPEYRTWQEFGRDGYICQPTHWQPLPEAPHA